jgi:3-mercaptopyruvate sulfurtransferase SseA
VAGAAHGSEDLQAGKQSYDLLCAQCHGADGDAENYSDILPIAGIKRRYPPEVIGKLSGAFSGRVLVGRDRDRLVQYLGTLRGAKGFADPGWLITPFLLERKATHVREFRILDTRSKEAYAAGHAANAVSVDPGDCFADVDDTAEWLGRLGVTPSTVVVVYDERGGLSAACAWWRIRRAGHPWVAVLDGGWRRMIEENRFTTTAVPRIDPTIYPLSKQPVTDRAQGSRTPLVVGANGWSWEQTLDENGFRRNEDLVQLAEKAALRDGVYAVNGRGEEIAHLALSLHLLGYAVHYDAASSILSVTSH